MTAFDYVLLTILAASSVIGLFRGLVKEVVSLISWIAAFVIANRYGAEMSALLPAAVPAGTVRVVAGFAILFIGTLLLGALVNLAIAHIIVAAGLRGFDRGLGALFGFARGVLIAIVAVMLAEMTDLPSQPVWRDAWLSAAAESAVQLVRPWLPDDWARRTDRPAV